MVFISWTHTLSMIIAEGKYPIVMIILVWRRNFVCRYAESTLFHFSCFLYSYEAGDVGWLKACWHPADWWGVMGDHLFCWFAKIGCWPSSPSKTTRGSPFINNAISCMCMCVQMFSQMVWANFLKSYLGDNQIGGATFTNVLPCPVQYHHSPFMIILIRVIFSNLPIWHMC